MIIHARGLVRRDRIVNTWSLSHISVDTSASIFSEDHNPSEDFARFKAQSSNKMIGIWNMAILETRERWKLAACLCYNAMMQFPLRIEVLLSD